MKRRQMIEVLVSATGAGALASCALHGRPPSAAPAAAPMPAATAVAPAAAPPPPAPRKAVDPEPHVNDVEKYPRCNYCNMDRKRFHHSRMLIHYGDETVDPLCSLRCAASSLTLNLGRVPKAIWVGDNASAAAFKPLIDAEKASYLVGSSLKGVMTRRSKVAYRTQEAAETAKAANGGEILDFDKALLAAYTDIAESVSMNLKTKDERLKRMQKEPQK
jgi:nitrous oxide reductase accessory protein NosL